MKNILVGLTFLFVTSAATGGEIAITIDDFRLSEDPKLSALQKDEQILEALNVHRVQAALFVIGESAASPFGKERLAHWDERGHVIANHTYTHPSYHSMTFPAFSDQILRTDRVIRGYTHYKKWFRFPMLKEGDTLEKRDQLRKFLADKGYRNGYVTVDASDWYINDRLIQRLRENPAADVRPYREFYLKHIWERTRFYDELARKLGKTPKHTLLIHHNLLNGLFLGDLLQMFRNKEWKLVSAEEAFADPIYNSLPNTLPTGESLIWALAKETGKFESILRYPGEDSSYEAPEMDKLGL